MQLIPNSNGEDNRPVREFNDCHLPKGQPTGGRFCRRGGGAEVDPPLYLQEDVETARRMGIKPTFVQSPDPVRDMFGDVMDPLSRSNAQHGEVGWADEFGWYQRTPTGETRTVLRGGEFDPYEMRGGFWDSRREKKEVTPEDLTNPATPYDVASTFRHEIGHLLRTGFKATKATPEALASEIAAWQYAVEAAPNHTISHTMVRKGLMTHAYFEFRVASLLEQDPSLKRYYNPFDFSTIQRMVYREIDEKGLDPKIVAKAKAFTDRAIRSLDAYGAVLRKRGTRKTTPRKPPPSQAWAAQYRKVHPGPGGRGML